MTSTAAELSTGTFVLLVLMSFVAFMANATVFVVIIIRRLQKSINSTDALIGNLALTDIIYSSISMPLTLAATTMGQSWTLGNAGCKLVMFLPNFCIAASIVTMIAIAQDRRTAVVTSKALFKGATAITVVNCTIWLLSLAIAAPALYEYSVYEKEYYASGSGEIRDESGSNEIGSGVNSNDTFLACGSHGKEENFEKVYAALLFVLIYLLPMVIISVNYLLIWLFIQRKAKDIRANLSTETGERGGSLDKGKSKILKMLLVLVFVFAAAWAPYFTIFVREELTGADDTAKWGSLIHIIKLVMAISSSILNPVIYAAFNHKFRAGFKSVFMCHCKLILNNRVVHVNTPVTSQKS